jgi:hypothetical protein
MSLVCREVIGAILGQRPVEYPEKHRNNTVFFRVQKKLSQLIDAFDG